MRSLLDKAYMKGNTLRNRFFVAPMTRVSADLEGNPGIEMLDYYKAFAEGGFGGIITEGIYTDDLFSKAYPTQPGLVNPEQMEAWSDITGAVRENDGFIIAQLMHAGGISQMLSETRAPSKIQPKGKKLASYGGGPGPFPVPEELSTGEIGAIVQGFVNAAKNAVLAGFNGIELHAANGYLLDQFITPYTNQRKDNYGGSVSNRLRIVSEIAQRIHEVVPENFVIGLRISEGKVNDLAYRWEGGSQMAHIILKEIKNFPVDYLHVAAEHAGWLAECRYEDGSSLTGLASEILEIPVIGNGKLHDTVLAQELLDSNQADFFAIGKMALSNPDFVERIQTGQDLKGFDMDSLYPNPSLLSDKTYRKYLKSYPIMDKNEC